MASWLGVGYKTLILHMRYGLNAILHDQTQRLLRSSPQEIRFRLLGHTIATHLHMVDEHWLGRAIDMEVGDQALVPSGTRIEGAQLVRSIDAKHGMLVEAVRPGIGRVFLENNGWAAYVRVSRRGYTGRSCFRFEEEVEE